ncbi:MAG: enoyl-CoA hydratase/isomerase family protein [Alphaproteobacteria bacterium]|nr:enoyl-CoA hydratase/isomerase family protein [Alphaproteobacteria bacterium]
MALVNLTKEDGVAVIELNRPEKLNAITPEMAELLQGAADACMQDSDIRTVILTGGGPKSFCAGSDIAELDTYSTPWQFRNRPDYCDCIRGISKPTIAAINGYAIGGGLEMAMSCDIRLAAQSAKFAAPEIKLGWIGGGGMTAQLAHAMGPSNAALMVMTGDPIGAEQALSWGLVSDVCDGSKLMQRAMDIARTIASRAPIAAETAKANLRATFNMPLEKAIEYERDLQTICFATEDAMEGRAAFRDKRPPVFHRK